MLGTIFSEKFLNIGTTLREKFISDWCLVTGGIRWFRAGFRWFQLTNLSFFSINVTYAYLTNI